MLIYFPCNMKYNEYEFYKGYVYDLCEDLGFANRWAVRGCDVLNSYDGVIHPDPINTHYRPNRATEKVIPEIDKIEVVVEEVEQEVEEVEEVKGKKEVIQRPKKPNRK